MLQFSCRFAFLSTFNPLHRSWGLKLLTQRFPTQHNQLSQQQLDFLF